MAQIKSTEGIVLKTINYSETSLIVKVFTEEFGVKSFMVKGAKSKTGKNKSKLFYPLSLLHIHFSEGKGDLCFMREASTVFPFQELKFNINKSAIVFFLNEFLYRIFLADDYSDKELYHFIKKAVLLLEETEESVAHFHVAFLAHFTKFMGIFPNNKANGRFFDITGGAFQHRAEIPFLDENTSEVLRQVIHTDFEVFYTLPLSKLQKKELLEGLLLYYKTHIDGFKDLKSTSVLHAILND